MKENLTFRERLAGALTDTAAMPMHWLDGGRAAAATIRDGGTAGDAGRAYTERREEIHDSAREFGQEHPDEVLVVAKIVAKLHGLGS